MKRTIVYPVFLQRLTLLVCSQEEYNKMMSRKYKTWDKAVPDDEALQEARKDKDGFPDRYLWFAEWKESDESRSLLQHEVCHMNQTILNYVGMRRTKASEECYVYYEVWLFNTCLRLLRKGTK